METVNKTLKNIKVGDLIAFGNSEKGSWRGKRYYNQIDPSAENYALPVELKSCIVEFLEVIEFGEFIQSGTQRLKREVLFSDGKKRNLVSCNWKYITLVK
jgi:hypothetical protein